MDHWARGEIMDHLDPWACLVLRAQSDSPSPEKPAVLDPRETLVTLVYLDRKARPALSDPPAQSDQLECGDLRGKKDRLDPEALQALWDLQGLLEYQDLQGNQETPETLVHLGLSVPKEIRENEVILLLRT